MYAHVDFAGNPPELQLSVSVHQYDGLIESACVKQPGNLVITLGMNSSDVFVLLITQ